MPHVDFECVLETFIANNVDNEIKSQTSVRITYERQRNELQISQPTWQISMRGMHY